MEEPHRRLEVFLVPAGHEHLLDAHAMRRAELSLDSTDGEHSAKEIDEDADRLSPTRCTP
jgi:hypothetical protein